MKPPIMFGRTPSPDQARSAYDQLTIVTIGRTVTEILLPGGCYDPYDDSGFYQIPITD